jgi:hypothetical protein
VKIESAMRKHEEQVMQLHNVTGIGIGKKRGQVLQRHIDVQLLPSCQDSCALNYLVGCTTLPRAEIGTRTSIFPMLTAKRGWLCLAKYVNALIGAAMPTAR